MTIDEIREQSLAAGASLFKNPGNPPFHIEIHPQVWQDVYFITSETHDLKEPRKFTVRYFERRTGKLKLVSDFRQFPSHLAAKKWLEEGLYNAERGITQPWTRQE